MAWIVYSGRDVLLFLGRWCLHRRYEIECSGDLFFESRKTYLLIPNHPAIVDPLIFALELHSRGLDVRPLVEEPFLSNGLVRHVLGLLNVVRFPGFRKAGFFSTLKIRPEYRPSPRRAKVLGHSILALLTSGENVLLYPSGHITADGRESLDNQWLAFNVMSQLPDNVEVIGVRIRGLFGSIWSRAGGQPSPPFVRTLLKSIFLWLFSLFRRKRIVSIYAENLTQKVVEWSKLPRAEFDKRMEWWYNADLDMKGLEMEMPT